MHKGLDILRSAGLGILATPEEIVADNTPAPRPTCGTCPHWDAFKDKQVGLCRIVVATGYRGEESEAFARPDWPKTDHDEWCGQHPDMAAWIETEWPKVREGR